jgi:uncharacterized protein YecE (DUF72 family)
MKKHDIHIGCSSYYNHQWTEVFYPKDIGRNKWFEYYCNHFNTYELNGTFYKFPTVKSLQTWYKKAPGGFTFSLKVPKLISHIKRLEDCQQELGEFYSACTEGLGDKLGCVLFQLPPSFSYSEEKLQLLLNAVNPEFRNVVEFRHESWWRHDVYNILTKNNIFFCSVNYPKLPTDVIVTNNIGYYRFHGSPKLFYSQYTIETLQAVLNGFLNKDIKETYVYFNNTASTAAIINAMQMKDLILAI